MERRAATPLLARELVGRDEELETLRDAWRNAGTTLIVSGPAGIGKSRLVRELGAWTAAQGAPTLLGRTAAAAPAAATPLRPIREALLAAGRMGHSPGPALAPFLPALAAVVPEWSDGEPALPESALLLGEAVLRFAASLAIKGTTTLVVDDLQWADPETIAVVEYLADNIHGQPVMLLLTVRDGEPGDGADLAGSLVSRRVAAEAALAPLSDADSAAVVRSCLANGVDELTPAALDELVARAEGVPFLVEELIATTAASGWDSAGSAVPGSLVASVERRLDALPTSCRPLLTAAALLGRSFEWHVAAQAADLEDPTAAELLRDAVRAQILDVEGAGFRFRHALTRDAVLAAALPTDLELLAGRALEALDASDAADLLLGADLADRARRPQRAAELLLDAARQALAAGAVASAVRFADRAAPVAADTLAGDVEDVLLQALVLAGDTERAATLGTRLLGRRTDPASRAGIHLLLGSADLAAGRWDDAHRHADAAVALDPDDDARRARSQALAAQAAMGQDDVDLAVVRAGEALETATVTDQASVRCEALEVLGRAERGRDIRSAETHFQKAYDIAAGAGLPLWRIRALQELGTVDLFGTLDLDRLDEARHEATALGALATVAVVDLQVAATHDERGEISAALAAARRCEDASRRWRLSTLAMSLGVQAMAHARLADRAEMERCLDEARATGEDADYVEAAAWGNAVPIYHLVVGDLPEAALGFDRGMDVIRARPAATFPYPGLWALVRTLLDDGGEAARAEVAALTFDTPVSRRMLVAADAVALGRAGDPAAASARFAEADVLPAGYHPGFRRPFNRLLVAADAHRHGWGEPVTWLRESLASFEGMGLDALAARCRAELRALGAPVPRRSRGGTADAAGTSQPVPPALASLAVTAREVDVLVLVAGGATNREVAEQLFISQRTVDKHVERLLRKTGATRSGLAAVARDAGLLRT